MKSAITLRGHHLLCLLTYIGAGYSEQFKENLNAIVKALERGQSARIVAGYDSICHNESTFFACPKREAQRCQTLHESEMDRLALAALSHHIGAPQKWTVGNHLVYTPALTEKMREAFAQGAIRRACLGCPWESLCTTIAQNSFHQTKLFAPWETGKKAPVFPFPKPLHLNPSNPPKDNELFIN